MFDQSVITEVYKPVAIHGSLSISWASTAAAGTTYQVYVDRKLAWSGVGTTARIPLPRDGARFAIGAVERYEEHTDFSAYLPATPKNRALLTWLGGTFQAADIKGFRIFGETTAGGGIDYNTPLASIQAYAEGFVSDGYGMGGYGKGGFGAAAASYEWTSRPYTTGTWAFAIKPYDTLGNLGTAATTTIYLVSPPAPPAANSSGARLTYTYNATDKKITLNWLASPG